MEGAFERIFHNELTAARNDGINIGCNQERELLMECLIAGGIPPSRPPPSPG